MNGMRKTVRHLAMPLAGLMLLTSVPLQPATAALVTTQQAIATDQAAANRAKVDALMQREDVRAEMARLGVDPDEAAMRVAALSDAEVAQIAGHLETMPAGQSVIGTILIIAGVTAIVLIVLDILGITDVFSFIRPQR
ncbi:PA2779 family protein [Marinivivus vitaminiproducens]|uniref:PA2779 family protein n=1 Tax=Marinivivus vitaminiproducens TaxID=3035935 RepID=UPI0027A93BAB|nr:PA2779 family protein [Geminicoccaceae bacterium SCSIO 64248]